MTIFKTWKYQGKSMDWIAEHDIEYLIWIYWLIASKPMADHKKLTDLEIAINKQGKDIFYKTSPEFKLYKTLNFWQFKWEKIEDVITKKRWSKYLWYLLGEISRSKTPDINLKHSIEHYLKKTWCVAFDRPIWLKWLTYCKTCRMMHKL